MNFDAIVFDVDGVLLDTRRSFTEGVLRAATPHGLGDGWTPAHVEALRLCGGFNNDWDAATALALLGPPTGPAGWNEACRAFRADGGGPRAVMRRTGEESWTRTRAAVVPRFQRLYAGPRAPEVYGVDATEPRGLYESEVALITREELHSLAVPFGILTGRTPGEALLALELLRLDLPPDRIVCDSEERYRKPRPDGLLVLASCLGARRLLYFGDSIDDLQCARNAGAAFAGIAPAESERAARFRHEGAIAVQPAVRDILRSLS
ncbi:MAG: HAD-IA family hydrolase [Planctomycetes bacterium]|nr:HAD-IA family hydrolase [Planctomycetota bacterium]